MSSPADPALRFDEYAFAGADALADSLARQVGERLRAAIADRGRALLAVSGGTTPRRFFGRLARETLPWRQVVVTLCDERWVAEDDERSNARFVRETLLRGPASAACFVPLYADAPDPEIARDEIERRMAGLALPLDVVVLGMGNDGHTASLFPGGSNLARALDANGTARVLAMRARSADEPRITLTLPVLAGAQQVYLHIEGAEKKAVLARILRGDDRSALEPVRAVMSHARSPVAIYWCP